MPHRESIPTRLVTPTLHLCSEWGSGGGRGAALESWASGRPSVNTSCLGTSQKLVLSPRQGGPFLTTHRAAEMLEPPGSAQLPQTGYEASEPLDFTGDRVQWEHSGAHPQGWNPSSPLRRRVSLEKLNFRASNACLLNGADSICITGQQTGPHTQFKPLKALMF